MIPTTEAILGALLDRLLFNVDYIDVILRLPELGWREMITSLTMVALWKLLCDQLDRMVLSRFRRWLGTLSLGGTRA